MEASNKLKSAFKEGRTSLGMWQMIPGANVSRILARTGVDWVLVDCEHGNIDDGAMHEAVPAIAALGASPLVRIPDMQSWMIKRALDSGAHGILVPLLRTVDEAKQLVQSAKFPPRGKRGFGSPLAMERFNPVPTFTEYLQQANDALLTMVQIETQEALEAVDEIAAVDGIDVLFIGPFDLGNNIGYPILNGAVAPELKDAIKKILTAARKAGKKCGIYASSGEQAREFKEQGFDMMNVATDHTILEHVVNQQLSIAQGGQQASKSGGLYLLQSETMHQLDGLARLRDVFLCGPGFADVNLGPGHQTLDPSCCKIRTVEGKAYHGNVKKCVHQGCGKQFTDPSEKCEYHPGPPIFHEGQKGWKCCKPRVLTFDEFMTIPPCTTGVHSTTDKPPQVEEKPQQDEAALSKKIDALNASVPTRAPIQTAQHAPTPPPPPPESENDDPSLEIPDGAECRRRACSAKYKKGSAREGEQCVHHPGVPIFHEGSKGYSCCKRRVLEFDQFMKIEGCKTKDKHLFIGSGKKDDNTKSSGEEALSSVRHDFYQTSANVIASIFLKKIVKETAKVEFQAKQLVLDLVTSDSPPKRYAADVPLFGQIDVEKSSYKVMGTKLELTLVKADGASWPVLRGDEALTGEILQVGKAGRVQ
ncbi:Cysteine and histidine-rich domain-containing protein [Paramyrothecium foliicola]|nr:Cysteine and histidine-rich domain-containing protein [Paramyrothecium foliicola]